MTPRRSGRRTRVLAAVALTAAALGLSVAAAPTAQAQIPCIPSVSNDSYSTPFETTLTLPNPGVQSNDNTCGLPTFVLSGPSDGAVTLDTDGGLIYTPDAGFSGTDGFTYTFGMAGGANPRAATPKGGFQMTIASVEIVVEPEACQLELNNDIYIGTTDTPLNVAAPGVTANDTLCDAGVMQWTDPTHGTITSFNSDGSFTYIPDAGYEGPDNFLYTYEFEDDGAAAKGRSPRADVRETAQVNLRINAAPTTTTTTIPTTTTEPQIFERPTTTTTTETTTTVIDETTTIVEEPTTTVEEPAPTTPATTDGSDIIGEGIDRPAGTGLARTGSSVLPLGYAGVTLIGAGIAIAALVRKRRAEQA